MRRIRGFDTALSRMNSLASEPLIRMQQLSSAVRVGPRQFRHLHTLKEEAVRILDMDDSPELYVRGLGGVNAITVGMDRPFIVLGAELVELMDEDELRFVIGHELGHVLSGHAIYHTMGQIIAAVGLSAIPGVSMAADGIEAGIREWFRKSELSCDRAGLLVAQDTTAAIGALMKLAAGARVDDMNVEEFLQQAAEFELDTTGVRNRIYKFLLPSESHPILVLRAAELDRWVRIGGYGQIVGQGKYEKRGDDAGARVPATFKTQFAEARKIHQQKVMDRIQRQSGQAPE
jgi:Zn-dependent protease with chaperone function